FSRIVILLRRVVRCAEIVLDFHVIDSWKKVVGMKSEEDILSEYGSPKTGFRQKFENWIAEEI
ncbi:MAG TPA: hypothetical protein VK553_05775, partial [Candidatus Nitrosopolaris rasttigaisensis]|nr:hypothetical protein [Candidatus Nitrosopolaris rasttigaisensis]